MAHSNGAPGDWNARQNTNRGFFNFISSDALQGWRRVLPYALLLSVATAIYLQTLAYGFVWDDTQYILDNFTIQAFSWENIRTIWTTTHLYNYAPLHLQLLALIHAFSGLQPFGYHLAQLLLHGACVCLVYFVIKQMESPRVALLAALWFAVYPPNVESVAWVSETKTTLAFALFLISFLFFMRHRERHRPADAAWCALFLTLSLLAKVSTIVAPAVFLAYEMKDGNLPSKGRMKTLGLYAAIAAVFVAIHLSVSQMMQMAALERLRDAAITTVVPPVAGDSTTYFGGFWTHMLNAPRLLFHYLGMTIAPHELSPWRMVTIDLSINLASAMMCVVAVVVLLELVLLRGSWRFWGWWFVLFLAPVLQLVPNATWVADRYLYIPAIGVFVLLSKLFFGLLELLEAKSAGKSDGRAPNVSLRTVGEVLAVAMLLLLGWQAHRYVGAWRDDITLWKAALRHSDASAYCHFQLGDAESSARGGAITGDSISHFERAVQIRPETSYQIALARAYTDQAGDYSRANEIYQRIQREGRKLPQRVIASIARNYYLAGNYERANNAIAAGLGMNPDFSSLLIVKGFVLWRENDFDAARRVLRQALELNHANPQAHHPPMFLNEFWQRPAEVGQLLRDVGPL